MNKKHLSTTEWLTIIGFSSVCLSIILFMFVFIPESVLYAKEGILRWLPIILIFGGIPISIYKVVSIFHAQAAKALAFGSILIIGPLFGFQSGKNEKIALDKDGVITTGYISKKWYSTVNKKNEWLVKTKFKVDSVWYESFTQTDKENIYEENQEVEIIYSKRNPELNQIYALFINE
ncbi:hypothetical protein [Plebeiibacterium sediminum]|uniref:Uncharacterized protein n=1 Tax=Plebeiibacterium sediminum TaxID=2992112 RepID=A0AAE3M9B1_9BACT|nr:hypothetical protein [Plebeiobacterium sediminum]MCW3789529.1 hypothetical protein [Plebeiobacterium sediminum]